MDKPILIDNMDSEDINLSKESRIDFTSKVISDELNEFFNKYHLKREACKDDVLWWGLCLIKLKSHFTHEFIDYMRNLLKQNDIDFIVVDNMNNKDLYVIFDYSDKSKLSLQYGTVIRKGIHPCVSSKAEKITNVDWYHLPNINSDKRCELANMYYFIKGLFSESIESISIVRDFKNDHFLSI